MKKGADSFVRDKRGKKVLEAEKGGDERIRVFLKQCKLVGLSRSISLIKDSSEPRKHGSIQK